LGKVKEVIAVPKFDVYLLSTYAIWGGVEAETEREAIKQCDPIIWPDPADGPSQFLAFEARDDGEVPLGSECPKCGEQVEDLLVWNENSEMVECQTCGHTYTP